ncbi:unnamed protein product [Lampetra fluviatilis]
MLPLALRRPCPSRFAYFYELVCFAQVKLAGRPARVPPRHACLTARPSCSSPMWRLVTDGFRGSLVTIPETVPASDGSGQRCHETQRRPGGRCPGDQRRLWAKRDADFCRAAFHPPSLGGVTGRSPRARVNRGGPADSNHKPLGSRRRPAAPSAIDRRGWEGLATGPRVEPPRRANRVNQKGATRLPSRRNREPTGCRWVARDGCRRVRTRSRAHANARDVISAAEVAIARDGAEGTEGNFYPRDKFDFCF